MQSKPFKKVELYDFYFKYFVNSVGSFLAEGRNIPTAKTPSPRNAEQPYRKTTWEFTSQDLVSSLYGYFTVQDDSLTLHKEVSLTGRYGGFVCLSRRKCLLFGGILIQKTPDLFTDIAKTA